MAHRSLRKRTEFALIFLVLTSLLAPVIKATDVCGDTATPSDQWTLAGSPYIVTCDVRVPSGGTLIVDAGVEVRFQAGTRLTVQGTLDVNGGSGNEVSFTSDAVSPAATDWVGLRFDSSSTGSTIDYASIAYATDAVYVNAADVDLDHVETAYSTRGVYLTGNVTVGINALTSQYNNDGLYFYSSNATVTVTDSTLTDNTRYGVFLDGNFSTTNPDLVLSGSSVHSNLGAYDFFTQNYANRTDFPVLARGNWWNTTDATAISSRIRDYREYTASPLVDFCGWLDSAFGSPDRDVECPDLAICDETVDWTVTARPYLLTTDLFICSTGTLNVGPGVEVRAAVTSPTLDFRNYGVLDVAGASGNEAIFTSDSASPAAGDWSGLYCYAGSSTTIEHAAVSYAANGIYFNATSATLDDVETTHSTRGVYVYGNSTVGIKALTARFNGDGLYINNSNSTVTVTNSVLTDNTQYGVYLNGNFTTTSPNLVLSNSSIHSNLGAYDYYTLNYINPSTTLLWAPDNWWGTTSHQQIADRIRDRDDISTSPRVRFKPFGMLCEIALGGDMDGDNLGDFEDNCPIDRNIAQTDSDSDMMGDACDPQPFIVPSGDCDGVSDATQGYADSDSDGWGDPCDFQPTRDDCYPGAPEICDGRDNDGDGQFMLDELSDVDLDDGLTCSDCDEVDPLVNTCSCEDCDNLLDDDCDTQSDGFDPDCEAVPLCVLVASGGPALELEKGSCGGASSSGPFDVIRGNVSELLIASGSVDLGNVACVAGELVWDRVTEQARNVNPVCNDPLNYYLARDTGAADFGAASSTEPRDVMIPDPPCP